MMKKKIEEKRKKKKRRKNSSPLNDKNKVRRVIIIPKVVPSLRDFTLGRALIWGFGNY